MKKNVLLILELPSAFHSPLKYGPQRYAPLPIESSYVAAPLTLLRAEMNFVSDELLSPLLS